MNTMLATLILAIAPAVVGIVAVVGVIGGLFAIFRRKKAPSLPPAVDDGGMAAEEFLNMRSATTTAMLERAGDLYVWSVAGPVPSNGSDADAGKAAVAMAQAMAASEGGATLTGEVGGPGNPTMDFGVEPEGEEWAFSVTGKSKLPGPVPGTPAPPIMYGQGVVEMRSTAILSALSIVSKHQSWLSISAPGIDPEKDAVSEPPRVVHGLVISADQRSVGIADLKKWIAFAAPELRTMIESGKTADEIMDATIADLPEDARLNGKPISTVRENVSNMLAEIRAEDYLAIPAPDDQLAALLVGSTLRQIKAGRDAPWVGRYKNHVILARPRVSPGIGGFQVLGVDTRWEYMIWEGKTRGYDSDAIAREVMGAGQGRNPSVRKAKNRIDDGQPEPEPPEFEYLDIVGDAVLGAADHPGETKEIGVDLASMWQKREEKDIEIFDFTKGNRADFKRWRIVVGTCMKLRDPAPKFPFGVLSNPDAPPHDGIKIRNASANDGMIGAPPPVAWDTFIKPLVWKQQIDAEFLRGPTITWPRPMDDITGSDAGLQVDPCPDAEIHWPEPSNPELGFYVQPVGQVGFQPWHPAPSTSLVWKSAKLYMRIRYSGFPAFAIGGGNVAQALMNVITKFHLDLKVWTAGTNKEQ